MTDSEHAFRLAVWSAAIQIVRALGRYWGMCDSIIIKKSEQSESIPVKTHGADVNIAGTIYQDE
jgi:hypothetical protein